MKTAHRSIVRIAAVIALAAAASASAFAQDGYRRGYDEGYASSRYDGGDERGGRSWGRIHIEEAEYGVRGRNCDARRGVRREVERTGVVVAHNDLCGDPALGVEKRLRIVYRCGDSEPMRAFGREGQTMRLRCRR
jgi:opacity protein-like surface antigen